MNKMLPPDAGLTFDGRKRDHIRLSLDENSQALDLSGLHRVRLLHQSLPELDFKTVTLMTPRLHVAAAESVSVVREFQTPFYVSGMTAGHEDAVELNDLLASACLERGWIFGLGSQRREIEAVVSDNPSLNESWSEFRKRFENLTVLGNLGASQLKNSSLSQISAFFERSKIDALAIHLNALQEALQWEGTPHFDGVFERLMQLKTELKIPLIIKETGSGMSRKTFEKLARIEPVAVDVSGLGGTHWGRIEGLRSQEIDRNHIKAKAAETFANWGISLVESLQDAVQFLPSSVEIWASGGIRSGLDAAKAIALGATRVGYAAPAMKAALKGKQELLNWMELQEYELRVALFCLGCSNPRELKGNRTLWKID